MREIMIIEDEQINANRLRRLINETLEKARFLPVLDSVQDALVWFKRNAQPDLIFMDVRLSDGSALEILSQINFECHVVIATAYPENYLAYFGPTKLLHLNKPIFQDDLLSLFKDLGWIE